MYKKQVKLQKVFCLMAIIASVLVFAYSLGLVTDLYDSLYTAMYNPNNPDDSAVTGARIFYDIQPFNNQLMLAGLGLIILSLGLFFTNTHVRRRYYIGNYVATAIWSVAAVAVTVWGHIQVEAFKHQFLTTVNFEELKAYAERTKSYYTDSTFWFDVHYLVLGVLLLTVVILVANAVWKTSLMKQEAALLAGSTAELEKGATAKAQ